MGPSKASSKHVAIWTTDLERLRAFYELYFEGQSGEKYVNPTKGFQSYFLQFASGARLELMSMPSIPQTRGDIEQQFMGIIHLAFAVGSEQEVDLLTERLERDGYRIVDGLPRLKLSDRNRRLNSRFVCPA